MNKALTEIAYILDRSGSMSPVVEPAIAGFNQFLREQREAAGEARLTLVLFDNEYLVPCNGLPIEEVVDLDTTTYIPRGTTALLDAIGRTIHELGSKLAATPESERPGQVIVAIYTDGLENASRDFDAEKISEMITQQREVYNWHFLFLAANQDAIATAARMGIDRQFASSSTFSRRGMHSSSRSFSRKISAMRAYSTTGRKCADLDAPMAQLVEEEEKKKEQDE